ncbi:MAG: DUF3488 domain-containing protein [Phycisphaerales bacterium]|nr:DUF3488 domain-containing protein [Phycisphaerales bacterium]
MNVERLAKNCVFIGAMLAIVCYAVAESELTWKVLALAHPPAVLGWWLTERLGKRPLSKWLANAAVAGAVLWAGYVVWATKLEVSTFCQFLILVMVIRIWDTKQAKDMAQIVVLSVFLVVGAILTDTRLHLAVLVLMTVPTIASAAAMLHILTAVERARKGEGRGNIGRSIAVSGGAGRHLGVMWLLGVAIGLIVSLIVFVIMPRGIGLRSLGRFGEVASSRTGFTDTVDLRRAGPSVESEIAVMEVRLEDDTGFPLGSPDQVLYLRGVALDQYERGAWTRGVGRGGATYELRTGVWQDRLSWRTGRRTLVQKVTIRDAGATTPLYAMLSPVGIKVEKPTSVRFSRWDEVLTRDDRQGRTGRLEYTVRSVESAMPRESALDRRRTPATFPSDRVTVLARSVLVASGIEPDPERRAPVLDRSAAEAIQNFLHTGFQYTLDTEAPPAGVDPIEAFLFDRKTGHCEVFAGAMAAMCRSVGVDARVVAGYLASEYDESAGVYTVRERHAHAWVEVLTDNWNWRTMDPTPPADLASAHRPRDSIAAKFNRWLDSLNAAWAVSVVSFDESSQRKLLGMNVNPSLEIQEKFMEWAGASESSRGETDSRRWVPVMGVLSLVVGGGVLYRLAVGVIGRKRGVRRPTPREARFYDDAIRVLRRAGIPKPEGVTPLEHASSLAAVHPAAPGVLREIGELYYEARFAGRRLNPEESARGKALAGSLRALLVR